MRQCNLSKFVSKPADFFKDSCKPSCGQEASFVLKIRKRWEFALD